MWNQSPILTSANAFLTVTNFAGNSSIQTFSGAPIGTADGTATGELAVKVALVGAGGSSSNATVTNVPKGAANQASNQVVTSTTAATFVAARATRRSVTLKNTDTVITVYVGPATVTSANGMPLKAGESISVDTTALIQVIAASGTPTVAYYETYD